MKIKSFTYEKANGEISERTGIIIKEPQKNYLMIDMSDLSEIEQSDLIEAMEAIDQYRDDIMNSHADLIKWRTFKPEGITWK